MKETGINRSPGRAAFQARTPERGTRGGLNKSGKNSPNRVFDAVARARIVGCVYVWKRKEDRWSKQRPTEEEGGEQNREENKGITLAVPGAGGKKTQKCACGHHDHNQNQNQRCINNGVGKEISISSWDRKDD
jgi:hypothetical protein